MQSQETSKPIAKMGLFSCFCLGFGTIVGAGIFGAIPAAAEMVGSGIVWAYLLAMLSVLLRFLPVVYTSAIIPAPFCAYTHSTRLVNPTLGFAQAITAYNFIFIVSAVALVFSEYFSTFVDADPVLMAVIAIVVFGIITALGVSATTTVQNLMVVLLVAALLLYIFTGAPHLNSEYISFGDIIKPKSLTLVSLGAVVAMLNPSLQGGSDITNYAHEIKNPGRNIPLSFFCSTAFACFLFVIISVITLGVLPPGQVASLKDVAQKVMSPFWFNFFILGGAIFAILTTLNGIFISVSRMIATPAHDKVFPSWWSRQNRFGVAQNSVLLLVLGSVIVTVFNLSIGALFSAFSFLTIFTGLILFIPALRVHKVYPHSYRTSFMKLPFSVVVACTAFGVGISIWQLFALLSTLDLVITLVLVGWIGGWYAYFFFRKNQLKKQGIDMIAIMRQPYPDWVKNEEANASK